jgi:general secretion pathway protein D
MMTMKKFWLCLSIAALTGCAHQTPIPPSQGHVGSEPETQAAAPSADIPKPVKKLSYVPPPKPKAKEQTYSVVVSAVPVQEVLFALARESKLNVDIDPTIRGKVTLNAVDQTLPAILDRLSKQLDMRYKVEGNVISIAPDFPVLRTYKIDYVNLERDTTTSLGAGSEVSTGASSGSSGGGSGSESKVTITSKAEAHFWDLLTNNVRNILSSTKSQVAANEEKAAEVDAAKQQQEDRLKQIDAVSKAGEGAEKLYKEAFKAPGASASTTPVTIGKDEVIVNPVAGVITVMATERQHAFIQQYIDGVMASVQRQVLIEATIVEVTLNNQFQQGIDWSRLASNGGNNGFTFSQNLGGTAANLAGTAANTTNQFILGFSKSTAIGNLAASIRLLNTFGDTRVLSSPKIMALNNQAALLKVVDNIVYFKVDVTPATISSSGSVSSPATYTTTPQVVPVGVIMSVTPQINSNGNVSLNVRPTISRIIKFVNDPNPALVGVANQVPQIQVREMETLLQVNTGQTVVLGGLMQDELDNTDNSVPGFANLPLIGKAFKSNNDIRTKTELVIFLRPTIVTSPSLDSNELKSFKQYLPNNQFPVAADEPAN